LVHRLFAFQGLQFRFCARVCAGIEAPRNQQICVCRSLASVCIPASVTVLRDCCFWACTSLSEVAFEAGSKLQVIGKSAFSRCRSLASVCIPASVEWLEEACFGADEEGNGGCCELATVLFEPQSKLSHIGAMAFRGCLALNSISIPGSIQTLAKNWAWSSGLRQVVFESSEALQKVIRAGSADLSRCCEFIVANGEGKFGCPGYATEIIPEMPGFLRLVKGPLP
jgi:hypothetical protein